MNKIEPGLILLAVTGLILVAAGLESFWVILIPNLILLGMLYNPLGFITLNNIPGRDIFRAGTFSKIPPGRLIASFFAGMPLSLVPITVLFRLREYPLGGTFTMTAVAFNLVVLIIFLVSYIRRKEKYYFLNLIRFSAGFAIALSFMLFDIRM